MPNAPEIASQFILPAGAVAPPWANTPGAKIKTATSANTTVAVFFISCSLLWTCRQEVVPDILVQPGSRCSSGGAFQTMMPYECGLVLFRNRHSQINGRQHGEYVRLNNCYKNMQSDERNWNNRREHSNCNRRRGSFIPHGKHRAHQQAQENHVYKFARKHIGPQPHGKRQDARRGADDFNGKKERRQKPIRPCKMLQVAARAVRTHTLVIEIEESQQRAAERNRLVRGGR